MSEVYAHNIEDIPDQLGYLILNEDGAVLSSHGDLINDEKTAKVFMRMVQIAWKVKLCEEQRSVQRLSLIFSNHILLATVSNGKIYIVKKAYVPEQADSES
ncbi:unnamed protein product [Clavelina lepadiformis]|uniref:Ragulator complex protein LAMTOR4 n=1 Tax=Clavelina lepadiformis TaxID=159417 RepID=A0ABP0FFF6_CLALP